MAIKDLREKRANLVQQARDVEKQAREAGRETMNPEEEARFDALMEETERLGKEARRLERLEDAEKTLAESTGRKTEPASERAPASEAERRVSTGEDEVRADAMRGWLLRGSSTMPSKEQREAGRRVGVDVDNKLLSFKMSARPLRSLEHDEVREWERRAAQTLTTTAGGYVVPDDTMRAMETALLRFGGMRQVADIIRTDSGADLPWPTLNDTTVSGRLLNINTAATNTAVTFGQLVLQAYKYSSDYILVPVELLQDSAINIPEMVGAALGERIGRITNTHFTTGDGSSKPNGVVTASTEGKAGETGQATSVVYASLVDLLHSVDPDYRLNARWMFADSTLKALKKITVPNYSGQTDGPPLWQPGIAMREPDTILGYPYIINQQVDAMAANAKSILFGDFSKYKIRDVRDVTLLRLDERFAEYHQVAFIAFSRHDGDLLDAGTNPVKHFVNSAS